MVAMILPFCEAATQLISVISHEEDLQNKSGHGLALGQGTAQPHKTCRPDAGVKPSPVAVVCPGWDLHDDEVYVEIC